jgi:hypothetical protein
MSDKPEKRRGAIDTLIVRDRTAVFWFLVACAVGTACATYTMLLAETLRKRPPFVVMDTAGAFYVPDGVTYGDAMNSRMHEEMGNLLAETLLARTPDGLVYQDRMQKLLWLDDKNKFPAKQQIDDELEEEADYFKSQRASQTVVIDKTVIVRTTSTQARTETTGTVTRTSIFSGQQKVEKFRFRLDVKWHQNENIRKNRGFPSQLMEFGSLTLEPITEL